jgi:hypothetical protein
MIKKGDVPIQINSKYTVGNAFQDGGAGKIWRKVFLRGLFGMGGHVGIVTVLIR